MAYFMEEMTVRDMHEAIEKTKTVIIPVGVVEQHGYHLPLSTDIHNAVQVTRSAGDKLNAVVAPSVNYCFSGGELLGTVNVSPNTFGMLISDICEEFVRMGFVNMVILMGHGGTENAAALKNTLQMILRRNPDMAKKITLSMIDIQELSPTGMEALEMEPEHDFHAGLIETSLMMYWVPDMVRDEIVMDEEEVARMLRTDCDWYAKREKAIDSPYMIEHVYQRPEVKVGVMGFPHDATPELGKKVCDEIVENLVKYVDTLENHRKNM